MNELHYLIFSVACNITNNICLLTPCQHNETNLIMMFEVAIKCFFLKNADLFIFNPVTSLCRLSLKKESQELFKISGCQIGYLGRVIKMLVACLFKIKKPLGNINEILNISLKSFFRLYSKVGYILIIF